MLVLIFVVFVYFHNPILFEPDLTLLALDKVGPDYVTVNTILTLCDNPCHTAFVKIVCGMCGCVFYRNGTSRFGVGEVSLNLCLGN